MEPLPPPPPRKLEGMMCHEAVETRAGPSCSIRDVHLASADGVEAQKSKTCTFARPLHHIWYSVFLYYFYPHWYMPLCPVASYIQLEMHSHGHLNLFFSQLVELRGEHDLSGRFISKIMKGLFIQTEEITCLFWATFSMGIIPFQTIWPGCWRASGDDVNLVQVCVYTWKLPRVAPSVPCNSSSPTQPPG